MQIYDLLHNDHMKVKSLLDTLIRTPEGSDIQAGLVDQIRDELIPHARAEEAVFYNSLRSVDVARDVVHHGYKEHVEAEALLRMMQAKTKMDIDQIGRAFEALKPKIRQEGVIKTTFDLVVNLMPPRFSKFLWGDHQKNLKSA